MDPTAPRALSTLVVNVAALAREEIGSTREYRVESARFQCDGARGELDGSLRLLRTDRTILAAAAFSTELPDECGACLEPIAVRLRIEFEEEFWPSHDPIGGDAIEIPPEREGFPIIDSEIDLAEPVRQYAVMARPMSPRCGAGCPGAGLPPPGEPEIDPRWAPLAALQLDAGEPAAGPG